MKRFHGFLLICVGLILSFGFSVAQECGSGSSGGSEKGMRKNRFRKHQKQEATTVSLQVFDAKKPSVEDTVLPIPTPTPIAPTPSIIPVSIPPPTIDMKSLEEQIGKLAQSIEQQSNVINKINIRVDAVGKKGVETEEKVANILVRIRRLQ